MFVFHIATHDNKKALLSIRVNGEEVASVFDQNHKDNHKNSMAGTTIGKKKILKHILDFFHEQYYYRPGRAG